MEIETLLRQMEEKINEQREEFSRLILEKHIEHNDEIVALKVSHEIATKQLEEAYNKMIDKRDKKIEKLEEKSKGKDDPLADITNLCDTCLNCSVHLTDSVVVRGIFKKKKEVWTNTHRRCEAERSISKGGKKVTKCPKYDPEEKPQEPLTIGNNQTS